MVLFDRALAADPTSAEAWTNKGALLHARGELAEARGAFDRALAHHPDHVDARFNRGQVRLLTGDWTGGWADYEARLEKPAWRRRHPDFRPAQLWRGEPLTDAALFVCEEQGLGDTLQFVRYLPWVRKRCARVVLRCAASLVPLLAGPEGIDIEAAGSGGGQGARAADRFVPLLSLPGIFGTTVSSVPASIPYLFADPQRQARWRERMPGQGLRAGLVWAGNPGHGNDRHRSCPLESLVPLLEVAGVKWFGLQKGEGAEQVEGLPPTRRFVNLGPDLADFADTAAVVANLDLVVTVDTAVAHLAGAMGKPTWVLIPRVPDWRWLMDRADTPWYPTMRLFRRRCEEQGWRAVATRAAAVLAEKRS